jgi:hypothetical protein
MTRSTTGEVAAASPTRDPDVRRAAGEAAADDRGDPATATARSGRSAPRGYRAAVLALLGVQLLITALIASRSFFFTDDLLYGNLLGTEPLGTQLLFRSWFGHLVPGFIAADWTFNRLFGLEWGVAAVIMIAVSLAATTALVRLLEALFGRIWRNVLVGALFGLSLMVVTQVMWWGAVMTNLVPLAASIAAMGSFVRWDRTRSLRHLVSMTACFLLAVAFYEKSILTAGYIGLLSILVLDAGLPWGDRLQRALRRWPAWFVLGGIALVDVGWYLTHDFILEAGPAPATRDLLAFLFHSFTEGFAPSFLGIHRPQVALLGSPLLTLVAANGLLLGVAAVTSLRSGRAFQAWVFFAVCYLLNQGVLGRGRVGLIGPHMGTLLRYQLENIVLFCVALAVALPYLQGAWPRRWIPRVRGHAMPAWSALAVCFLLLAPYWVSSARAELAASPGTRSRAWFGTLQTSLGQQQQRGPELAFVDGVVPWWLVYPGMAPFNRYERVLPQVLPDVPLTQTADRGLAVDDAGNVFPVAFEPVADLGGAGTCVAPGAELRLAAPSVLPEQLWFVRLQYSGEAGSRVRITLHNGAQGPDLRLGSLEYKTGPGEGRLVVAPGEVSVAQVVVEVLGSSGLCLRDVEIGSMKPEQ